MTKVAIKANALGAGSIELVAPNTASVRTLDLPDRDGKLHLEPIAFLARLTGSQSLPSGTATKVIFNDEILDTHGYFNPVTGEFTPTVPGWYSLSFLGYFTSGAASGAVGQRLYKNGVMFHHGQYTNVYAATAHIMHATWLVYANGTDAFSGWFSHTAGASTTSGGGEGSAFFGHLVRAA